MGTVGEQTGDQDNHQREQVPNTPAFDLNDYTIIKEGEAEILMPADKNKVFYNKTQVYHFFPFVLNYYVFSWVQSVSLGFFFLGHPKFYF